MAGCQRRSLGSGFIFLRLQPLLASSLALGSEQSSAAKAHGNCVFHESV